MRSKIELIYLSTEGRVGFNIKGTYYEYKIDTAYFPELRRLKRFKPGRALNLVKRRGELIKSSKRGGDV